MTRGSSLFDDVPTAALDRRGELIEEGRGAELWSLVTGRPRGLEWKDEALDRYGLYVIEVEDLRATRAELESLARERTREDQRVLVRTLLREARRLEESIDAARRKGTLAQDAEEAAYVAQVMAGR